MKRVGVYGCLLCALFAALTAVCSQVMVPLPFTPVPINLALLAVFVCGGALGPRLGAVSMGVYILLGAIGAPVFAGLSGGLGVIAGPTGGYIIGYLPAAVVMGLVAQRSVAWYGRRGGDSQASPRGGRFSGVVRVLLTVASGVPAIAACYALGTVWFMAVTGMGLAESLLMCVVPFMPGDALKVLAAVFVCEALRRPMRALSRV